MVEKGLTQWYESLLYGPGSAGISNGETWSYFIGIEHIEAPSPGVAAFIGFAAQTMSGRFESAGAFALHTPSLLILIQVTRRGRKGYEFARQAFADFTAIRWAIL